MVFSMSEQNREFEEALLSLDRVKAKDIILSLSEKNGAMTTVENVVVPVLSHIGEGWESGELALAQIYMSGRLCEELIDIILPPADHHRTSQPKMAIAVLEDHHTLGESIIYSLLRASGFAIRDYGHGVTVDQLVQHVIDDNIEVLLISVLMLRSALRVKDLTSELKSRGLNTKVVVGGAPFRFDPDMWQEVGATAVGINGNDAIRIVTQLLEEAQS